MSGARAACVLLAFASQLAVEAPAFAQEAATSSAAAAAAEAERLAAEARRLERIAAENGDGLDDGGRASGDSLGDGAERPSASFAGKVLQMAIALGAICALAYVLLGKGLPWLMQLSPAARRNLSGSRPRGVIEVVDRLPLDPKRTLYVVKMKSSYFLVGASDQGLSLISRVEDDGEPVDKES